LAVAASFDAVPWIARFGSDVDAFDDESRAAGALWAEALGVVFLGAGTLPKF
jgi:hypothetical protein